MSKKKRDEAVADAKEGKITASITSWSDVLTGVDQADSLKWASWVDSLSADDRKALVNLVKNENEITAAAIFNSATPEVKLALGGKEGLDKIGIAGVGNSTGITVILTAIKGNKGTNEANPKGNQSSESSSNQLTINKGQQNKHIVGTNEHKISLNTNQNKSIITVPPETLLPNLGKGEQVGKIPVDQPGSKERINYGKIIGNYTDPETGKSQPTTNGIVHYGKNGVHIVPSRPSE
ncbi:TPA: hypothetical protein U2J54_003224 [Providencia rettgeri]|nr:hypothetical protein [Providencia rettgeri]HEM8270237.1 hypothetical protein [Providencia rettgeri]